MGGTGGGIAYNKEELVEILERGLALSPVHEVLIEESALGWKEYELEVMRDLADNCIIICSIENFDPMGVHTGDSITVAPAQTLTDREYQMMRDGALRCLREIGVDTGGSNVQFAINPANGRMVIIEMNPRVSRSSALASKATGFPIAKIAAKLAVGYRLDEIRNDITLKTPACFEPTIDYVVVKIPKWAFEKFPGADTTLGTQMKSVGEVMAIGRTFKAALWKGIRSLETGKAFGSEKYDKSLIANKLITPTPDRLELHPLRHGQRLQRRRHPRDDVHRSVVPRADEGSGRSRRRTGQAPRSPRPPRQQFRAAKRFGISDSQLAKTWGVGEIDVRNAAQGTRRHRPSSAAWIPAPRSSKASRRTSIRTTKAPARPTPATGKKVMILGSGPNRIGQGIEFDYCCCHAVFSLQEMGVESIMVNCNPETVSTDYDTSDRLYFEPLTLENVLNIVDTEKPDGVIVQFGGQTPLNLALPLKRLGVPIIGTDPEDIDLAEDRKLFGKLLDDLKIPCPDNGTATSVEEACAVAARIGYPVLVRPSYVLGGRAMVIAYDEEMVRQYMREAVTFSQDRPVLVDRFLEDATEVDVDALGDGTDVLIAGIMEHIEEAGVHSGDSSCVLPPQSLSDETLRTIEDYTVRLAKALQRDRPDERAVRHPERHGLRAGSESARLAHRAVCQQGDGRGAAQNRGRPDVGPQAEGLRRSDSGKLCRAAGLREIARLPVQQIPRRGPGARTGDALHRRSDGRRHQFRRSVPESADLARAARCPKRARSSSASTITTKRKPSRWRRRFAELGFQLAATRGTAAALRNAGLACKTVLKVNEGRPNAVDLLKGGSIQLAIYTTAGASAFSDEKSIRRSAVTYRVPCITTMSGARAAAEGVAARLRDPIRVWSLQEIHAQKNPADVSPPGRVVSI